MTVKSNSKEHSNTAPSNQQTRSPWQSQAQKSRRARNWTGLRYKRTLLQVLKGIIPRSSRVLYVGSGRGDILAGLEPSVGVGIEPEEELTAKSRELHPELDTRTLPFEEIDLVGEFDYVVAADLLLDCYDVDVLFNVLKRNTAASTRLVVTNYSQFWRPVLKLLRLFRIARPRFGNTWFSPADVRAAFERCGFDVLAERSEILFPGRVPFVSSFMNRFVARLPFFRWFCLHRVFVARPAPKPLEGNPSVTVLVPARNESGNVPRLMSEIPEMGSFTEVLFVEGNSTDDTWEVLQKAVAERDSPNVRLIKQPGKGKGDAVRAGFSEARGDILMILDADLTVPAEMLPRFYDAITTGRTEFANGTRLVYQMDDRAMRFLNLLGNHFFAFGFTYVMGQPIRDTLCGTKALTRESYQNIAKNRSYFGDFDPFGDFDLLFGAAHLNMKILDVPIRYREREYGETNISRFRHGLVLLRMLFVGARKLKFR
jgi:hypothetical protein